MIIQGHEIIAKILVGSRAYGTDIEGSDWDFKGVFIQDPLHLFLHGPKEFIKLSEDEIYYELGYFARLCCNQNPTILEMLYAPDECVVHSTEHWRRFQNKRELILSKVARHSYKGYIAKELKEFTRGPKQGAHIARLLFTANTIATQGIVRVRLHDAELAIVRNIRAGKISLESVVTLAEQGMAKLDELFKSATILEVSDVKKVKEKVLDIKKEYFKRYDNTRRYSEDIQTPDV